MAAYGSTAYDQWLQSQGQKPGTGYPSPPSTVNNPWGAMNPQPLNKPQEAPSPSSTGSTFTRREAGGWVVTYQIMSDGSTREVSRQRDRSAGESAAAMFRAVGMDDNFVSALMGVIEGVYANSIDPSEGEILSAIYNSEPYKKRFVGNEMIRQRMASGNTRPGDRMLTPREYLEVEGMYRKIFQDAGMPDGYYDTPDDFATLIGNSVSVAEVQRRVDIAGAALNDADAAIVDTLNRYYGISRSDLVAYLLDPAKAMPVLEGRSTTGAWGLNSAGELELIYRTSSVGGFAERSGLSADRELAEEVVDQDKDDMADSAFAQAGAADPDLRRLGRLYENPLDFQDMVRETMNLTGGVEAGKKRRKLASKERAQFSKQGAVDRSSVRRREDV